VRRALPGCAQRCGACQSLLAPRHRKRSVLALRRQGARCGTQRA